MTDAGTLRQRELCGNCCSDRAADARDDIAFALAREKEAGVLLDLLTVVGLAGTDDAPSLISLVVAVPFTVFGLALLVELGLRKGTTGPNRYGPDPLEPQTLPPRG